jgi:hypothetical protein
MSPRRGSLAGGTKLIILGKGNNELSLVFFNNHSSLTLSRSCTSSCTSDVHVIARPKQNSE